MINRRSIVSAAVNPNSQKYTGTKQGYISKKLQKYQALTLKSESLILFMRIDILISCDLIIVDGKRNKLNVWTSNVSSCLTF